jgi:hypothetical protein
MRDSIKGVVLCVVCFLAGYVCVSMLDSKPAPIEVEPIPIEMPHTYIPSKETLKHKTQHP